MKGVVIDTSLVSIGRSSRTSPRYFDSLSAVKGGVIATSNNILSNKYLILLNIHKVKGLRLGRVIIDNTYKFDTTQVKIDDPTSLIK
jgi:hypothetical protein